MDELKHYGVKGMKWGVRKLDRRNGDLYLKKGTVVKRVATDTQDRVHNNKKYVSINDDDHQKWESYLGQHWLEQGYLTTVHAYKTAKELKVMDSTKQGELYTKMLLDKKFKKQAYKDLDEYYKAMPNVKKTDDAAETVSRLVSGSAKLKSGQMFIDKVLESGYDALFDTHGTNMSKSPVIVLNADTNLKKLENVEYTKTAKRYLQDAYGIAA